MRIQNLSETRLEVRLQQIQNLMNMGTFTKLGHGFCGLLCIDIDKTPIMNAGISEERLAVLRPQPIMAPLNAGAEVRPAELSFVYSAGDKADFKESKVNS